MHSGTSSRQLPSPRWHRLRPAVPEEPPGPAKPTPAGPCGPMAPIGPGDPTGPTEPCRPMGPNGPAGPVGPGNPPGPAGPVAPMGPIGPGGPGGVTGKSTAEIFNGGPCAARYRSGGACKLSVPAPTWHRGLYRDRVAHGKRRGWPKVSDLHLIRTGPHPDREIRLLERRGVYYGRPAGAEGCSGDTQRKGEYISRLAVAGPRRGSGSSTIAEHSVSGRSGRHSALLCRRARCSCYRFVQRRRTTRG
jgi:hypothetical protein